MLVEYYINHKMPMKFKKNYKMVVQLAMHYVSKCGVIMKFVKETSIDEGECFDG